MIEITGSITPWEHLALTLILIAAVIVASRSNRRQERRAKVMRRMGVK